MRDCYRTFITHLPRLLVAPLVAVAVLLTGCDSQLQTEPYSEITPEQFYQNESEFEAAVTGVASQLRALEDAPLNLQEHTSDETMVPTRGPDWGDGGIWRDLTQHTWNATHPFPNNAWNAIQVGIARANGVLSTLQGSEALPEAQKAQFAAEVRFLRAIYYYYLMDLFGNVPIVVEEGAETSFTTQDQVTSANPAPQNTRAEVFSFLLSELTGCTAENFSIGSCIDSPGGGALADLPGKADVPYGRATAGAGYALLARILLNAEIYTGEVSSGGVSPGMAMYEEAAAAANVLIDGALAGEYMLTDDYFENFAADNANSPEIIFPIPHSADAEAGFVRHNASLHYNQPLPATPWNGFTTIAEFYASFDSEAGADGQLGTRDDVQNDDRVKQFMVGAQYQEPSSGCYGSECYSDPNSGEVTVRGSDTQLNFTLEIPSIRLDGSAFELEAPGARPMKWELDPGAVGNDMGNDYPLFRLAEMYLIRAEAQAEANMDPTAASDELATLRGRANAATDDLPPTTMSEMRALILQERGRELHFEGVRRQDLIRYEFAHGESAQGAPYTTSTDPYAPTYTAPWLFKEESDGFRALFPIPEAQISVNPNLQQNPGY
jgi:hypothetical protein